MTRISLLQEVVSRGGFCAERGVLAGSQETHMLSTLGEPVPLSEPQSACLSNGMMRGLS